MSNHKWTQQYASEWQLLIIILVKLIREDVNEEKSEETDMIKNQIESVVVKSKEQVENYKEGN